MRAFVAVWPTDPVRRTLRRLERPERAGVRWTAEEQWHVTLAFLGDVDPASFPRLADTLEGVARGWGPVTAVLGPRTERSGPGVLWVPVSGLDDLAAAVRGALGTPADPGPAADFHGHLTVARSRGRRRLPAGLDGAAASARWAVTEVSLVTSALEPGGARYTTVAAAPLGSR